MRKYIAVRHLIVTFCLTCEIIQTNVDSAPLQENKSNNTEEIESRILKKPQTYYEMDDMMVPSDRAGQLNEVYRWRKGLIPYSFGPGYSRKEMMDIHMTMSYIEEFTCITFRYRQKKDDNYILVRNVKGKCSSYVGNVRTGPQTVALDPESRKCSQPHFPGHVLHELVHAIGFFHEHARDDRDAYIDIVYANLPKDEGTRKNYNRNVDNKILSNTFGVPYNFGSVMHYSRKGGSVNGKDTIVRKKKNPKGFPPPLNGVMGQRDRLSGGDIIMIQRMYQHECPGTVDVNNVPDDIPDLEDWMEERQLNSESEPEFSIENVTDGSTETIEDSTTAVTTTQTRRTTTKKFQPTTITRRPNLFDLLKVVVQNIVHSG